MTLLRELHSAELPAEGGWWPVPAKRWDYAAGKPLPCGFTGRCDCAGYRLLGEKLCYGAANHRQIGNGPMLVLSDSR